MREWKLFRGGTDEQWGQANGPATNHFRRIVAARPHRDSLSASRLRSGSDRFTLRIVVERRRPSASSSPSTPSTAGAHPFAFAANSSATSSNTSFTGETVTCGSRRWYILLNRRLWTVTTLAGACSGHETPRTRRSPQLRRVVKYFTFHDRRTGQRDAGPLPIPSMDRR